MSFDPKNVIWGENMTRRRSVIKVKLRAECNVDQVAINTCIILTPHTFRNGSLTCYVDQEIMSWQSEL